MLPFLFLSLSKTVESWYYGIAHAIDFIMLFNAMAIYFMLFFNNHHISIEITQSNCLCFELVWLSAWLSSINGAHYFTIAKTSTIFRLYHLFNIGNICTSKSTSNFTIKVFIASFFQLFKSSCSYYLLFRSLSQHQWMNFIRKVLHFIKSIVANWIEVSLSETLYEKKNTFSQPILFKIITFSLTWIVKMSQI